MAERYGFLSVLKQGVLIFIIPSTFEENILNEVSLATKSQLLKKPISRCIFCIGCGDHSVFVELSEYKVQKT